VPPRSRPQHLHLYDTSGGNLNKCFPQCHAITRFIAITPPPFSFSLSLRFLFSAFKTVSPPRSVSISPSHTLELILTPTVPPALALSVFLPPSLPGVVLLSVPSLHNQLFVRMSLHPSLSPVFSVQTLKDIA